MTRSAPPLPEPPADRTPWAADGVLVADIGGTQLRVARLGRDGVCELLALRPTPAQDWDRFCATLDGAIRPFASGARGLSLSIAGLVSPETGQVTAANLPCLGGRPLAAELTARLGMPVVVTNDADCAALAEAWIGAGVGHDVVFCAVLGTGVGGGLVIKRQLVRGAGGLTGEWGHAPLLDRPAIVLANGRRRRLPRLRCGCGLSGCVDTVGGARGLERLHAFVHGTAWNSHQILDAWMAGEPQARVTVDAYLGLVAAPLALVLNVTGAGVVPVCGGLGRCAALVAALDRAVRPLILRHSEHALVVPSTLNDQAGLIGAAFAFDGISA